MLVAVSRSYEKKNAFVGLVSNLIAKGCWKLENRVFRANESLGGIIDIIWLEQIQGSIYKKGKNQRQFYGGPESRERQLMMDLLLVL